MGFATMAGTRLRLIELAINTGKKSALEAFWKMVESSSAPLVEYCDMDEESVFITFVYRDWNSNLNIIVFGSFPGYQYHENRLSQLNGTDIWFKTYKVRNDVRFSYSFSVMDQFSEEYAEISKYRILDSLNPNRIQFAKDVETEESESQEVSLVELPFAPKNGWLCKNKNNAQGELTLYRLVEIREKEPRRVWVYVPHDYNDNGHAYNLAILLDGFEFVEKLSAKNVLDNIISQGKLMPTICVFVDNKDRRYEELTCNDAFSDRMVEELMPWVRMNFNVSEEPDKVLIGGFSLGGLAAAHISMKYANVFGNVLCLSGSFWWDDEKIIKSYEQEPLLPLKFYLSVGLLEDEPYDTEPVMMKCVDKFCKTIQQKGNIVCYEKFHSGHDYLSWGESFGAGLISLFGNG